MGAAKNIPIDVQDVGNVALRIGQLAERTPPTDAPAPAPTEPTPAPPPAEDVDEAEREEAKQALKQLANQQLAEDESRALIDRLNRSAAGA